jgi:hypothetical protein
VRKPLPELLLAGSTCVVFVAVLAGLEYGLRAVNPRYLDRDESALVYSDDYGWKLRAGFQGVFHGAFTTINAREFRGRNHPLEKPAGRTRILMLGDSIAFGHGVSDGETFSALVESRDPRYDVVNLSVEGYGTDQELLRLEREGLRYSPDVVILNFCLTNDVVNNELTTDQQDPEERSPKPYFSLEGETLRLHDAHLSLSPPRRVAQWLQDQSHLYRRLISLLPARGPRSGPLRHEARLDPQAATDLTFRLIRRIAERSRLAGARFLLLLHPDQPAFRGRSPLRRKFCKSPLLEGIPVVDVGDSYRARQLEFDQVCLDYQGHLTPLGHAFAAQLVETLLAEPPTTEHRVSCPETGRE